MWPALIPAIFQGVSGLTQLFSGQDQLAGLQRPEYQIPDEQKQALAIARQNYADQTMPGYGRTMDQINLQSANALRAVAEGGAPLTSITGVQAKSQQAALDLGVQSANYQRQDELAYQAELKNMAQAKDMQWKINEFDPYAQAYAEGRQQIGAGMTNIFGALDSAANVAMAGMWGNQPSAEAQAQPITNKAIQEAAGTNVFNNLYDMTFSPQNVSRGQWIIKNMFQSWPKI